MIVGYARVSTQDQNLQLQIDALQNAGCFEIFEEKITGTKKDRPALNEMLKMLRSGDRVVVYKLDRISRSTKHLIELAELFEEKGVEFVSISDSIDTSTSTGRFFFRMLASLAELERDIISERTKAGLQSARARGRKGGRPTVDKKKVDLALKMYNSKQYSISEIVKATGISQATLYRKVKM
ncbi:recombinase family protein [Mesobacillus stamsii]|uniref:DNA invertase Pin-like site-specific DNA recombinase n=1 Tax=Mesobacillus stamsii TaxID=225347 RepID=A0ABU0G0T1_9BACI|nr:recombinase family protein [Mesobacillus stamsii]MDQ0415805.1 DNA invertase Pin-like site-specific DNA recombinase [Mesobacillus stamsii]